MEKLTEEHGKGVWLSALSLGELPPSPFKGDKFTLMLVHFAGSVDEPDKMTIARHLIAQGCRYAVCAGHDADDWEDAFDHADLEVNPELEEDRFVMTTSHGSETLEEVARFFVWNTSTRTFDPRNFLVVMIGASASDEALLRSTIENVLVDADQLAFPGGTDASVSGSLVRRQMSGGIVRQTRHKQAGMPLELSRLSIRAQCWLGAQCIRHHCRRQGIDDERILAFCQYIEEVATVDDLPAWEQRGTRLEVAGLGDPWPKDLQAHRDLFVIVANVHEIGVSQIYGAWQPSLAAKFLRKAAEMADYPLAETPGVQILAAHEPGTHGWGEPIDAVTKETWRVATQPVRGRG